MNLDKLNNWLSLIANVGVVIGLVFVAFEIQTNTESNRIAIDQNYATNWMTINQTIVSDPDLTDLLVKIQNGEEASEQELIRFRAYVALYTTQTSHMLRLYDAGLVTEQQLRLAFRATRNYAQEPLFRKTIEYLVADDTRFRGLILDADGFEKWL